MRRPAGQTVGPFAVFSTLVFAMLLAIAKPATADHGVHHYDAHARDYGSCCVEAWAHTRCSNECDYIAAGIFKSPSWYFQSCNNCVYMFSQAFVYSSPVTVYTHHTANEPPGGSHNLDKRLQTYYS
ncbi:MAG: hypothetical protein ACRD29_01755 [Acidimicrobiales bacterium]